MLDSDKLIKLNVKQIKERFNFDFLANLNNNEKLIPASEFENQEISVMLGKDFDLHKVGIKKHVPKTSKYIIYEYRCQQEARRVIRLLHCTHEHCGKVFRKWHNFFDHLRIHTNERPYSCTIPGCNMKFTQRANLNKHMDIHMGIKRFTCNHCLKSFYTRYNLNVSIEFSRFFNKQVIPL